MNVFVFNGGAHTQSCEIRLLNSIKIYGDLLPFNFVVFCVLCFVHNEFQFVVL